MSLLSSLPTGLSGLRALEAIAGSNSLFMQPGGVDGAHVNLGLDALSALGLGDAGATADQSGAQAQAGNTADANVQTADAIDHAAALLAPGAAAPVAQLLSAIEGAAASGDTNALGDALTHLGQEISAVGQDNGSDISQAVLHTPGEVTGLNDTTGNVADVLTHTGSSVSEAGNFVNGEVGNLADAGSQPLTTTANNTILDFHDLLEGVADNAGLASTVHGVTNLGETVGLGKIGDGNLVTDAVNLPSDVLSGDTSNTLGNIGDHLADVTAAATGPITGLATDLGSDPYHTGLLGSGGVVGGSGLDLGHLGDVLSGDGSGPLGAVTSVVDDITHATDGVGSGSAGTSNLVTDTLNLPGEVLSGNGTPSLTDAGHQLDTTVNATGTLVNNVLSDLGNGGATSQGPTDIVHSIVADVNSAGTTIGAAVGVPQTLDGVHAATDALGLGSSSGAAPDAGSIVSAVAQTVQGAVSDVGHDAALSSLGSGTSLTGGLGDTLHLPSLGGSGLDGLVGTATHAVASVADAGAAAQSSGSLLSDLDAGHLLGTDSDHQDQTQHTQSQHTDLLGHALGGLLG